MKKKKRLNLSSLVFKCECIDCWIFFYALRLCNCIKIVLKCILCNMLEI